MARYFNEQTLLDMRDKDMNYVYDLADLEQYLAGVPTADVVPRSEVEALEEEIERLQSILNNYALQYGTVGDRRAVIDSAKVEVAREIFNDIDKIAYRYLNDADYSGGDMIYDLNELKEKYTKGGVK